MKRITQSKTLLSMLIFAVILLVSGQAFAQTTGQDVANEALKYVGNGTTMDSATNVQFVYNNVGIKLPGTLDTLSKQGTLIRKGETLQPGDIVFFGTSTTRLTSAGIFIGNNQFVISYQPYKTIRVMKMTDADPARYYLGARRIIQPVSSIRERVIREGLKYVGTPYEYGSDRSSTTTMDCSDFTRRTYYDATGKWIPGNSRTQAAYVREYGKVTTVWSNLKRGDLMFFTNSSGTISHVAIYMGDGQILHATSTRGVHVGTMNSYWIERFTFGGNILD